MLENAGIMRLWSHSIRYYKRRDSTQNGQRRDLRNVRFHRKRYLNKLGILFCTTTTSGLRKISCHKKNNKKHYLLFFQLQGLKSINSSFIFSICSSSQFAKTYSNNSSWRGCPRVIRYNERIFINLSYF